MLLHQFLSNIRIIFLADSRHQCLHFLHMLMHLHHLLMVHHAHHHAGGQSLTFLCLVGIVVMLICRQNSPGK